MLQTQMPMLRTLPNKDGLVILDSEILNTDICTHPRNDLTEGHSEHINVISAPLSYLVVCIRQHSRPMGVLSELFRGIVDHDMVLAPIRGGLTGMEKSSGLVGLYLMAAILFHRLIIITRIRAISHRI